MSFIEIGYLLCTTLSKQTKTPVRVPEKLYCETSHFKFNDELKQYVSLIDRIFEREDMKDKISLFYCYSMVVSGAVAVD